MNALRPPDRRQLGDDHDVLVVGSGVAGLSVALGLAGHRRVLLVTTGALGSGSTPWAQGGVAAALGDDDEPSLHAADTEVAGAGACDPEAVRLVTDLAPARVLDLVAAGARLDRDAQGRLALTREGGHHRRRVAHAGGDATGAEVSRTLVAAVRAAGVAVLEHTSVLDLRVARDRTGTPQVVGLVASTRGDQPRVLTARAVVLATGGVGGVYAASTNPTEVAGAGLALALRAGATLVDLEFVQFHPTALRVPGAAGDGGQIPLVTEALRGEGAVLVDGAGRRVMAGRHPLADLAPRDVVARRIDEVLAEPRATVGLDATGLGARTLQEGFPTVWAACARHGIDPSREPVPVGPVQHFLCGGVRTEVDGATDVAGLYAVGEVAATGLHGANRLASNSLVEGMVLGRRVAERLTAALPPRINGEGAPWHATPAVGAGAVPGVRTAMSRWAGVRRSGTGLDTARAALDALAGGLPTDVDAANRWTVAHAVVAAAAERRESRGCHWRDDARATDGRWRQVAVRLDVDGRPAARTTAARGSAERLGRTA